MRVETRVEKEKKKRRDILERGMKKTEECLESWNPHEDPKAESDPFRTLFIARINYDTSQSKLKREFEEFGRIRHVNTITVKFSVKKIQNCTEFCTTFNEFCTVLGFLGFVARNTFGEILETCKTIF